MIARVDQVLQIPNGLLTGRLSAITKTGETAVWDFSLYKKVITRDEIKQTAMLYIFSSKRRGLEAKILIRDDGDEIWLRDVVRNQLFRKRDLEKFQGVLNTGFSYQDISGSSFQASYSGRRAVAYRTRDKKIFTRLTMVPINPGRYKKLVLLADQSNKFRPIRIDYHKKYRILYKTLNFYYGDLLVKKTGRTQKVRLPTRLEMMDLSTGMISRLEYFTLDNTVSPNNAFFDPDFLNR